MQPELSLLIHQFPGWEIIGQHPPGRAGPTHPAQCLKYVAYEWRFLSTERLIDFIRVHLSQIGGITAGRKFQIFAEQFGVRTAWHGPGDMSPLARAANIHIDLAARNFGVQKWSGTEPSNFVIRDLKGPREALLDVFPGLPEFRNGHVCANDEPGLCVDIDETEAAKYPCENTVMTWTQTRLQDGTLQTP